MRRFCPRVQLLAVFEAEAGYAFCVQRSTSSSVPTTLSGPLCAVQYFRSREKKNAKNTKEWRMGRRRRRGFSTRGRGKVTPRGTIGMKAFPSLPTLLNGVVRFFSCFSVSYSWAFLQMSHFQLPPPFPLSPSRSPFWRNPLSLFPPFLSPWINAPIYIHCPLPTRATEVRTRDRLLLLKAASFATETAPPHCNDNDQLPASLPLPSASKILGDPHSGAPKFEMGPTTPVRSRAYFI